MDLQMNGKTALVTGASAGIGKAIAYALAREGVDVAICARRREPLEAAASQVARETNRKVVAIPTDLTRPEDAEAFVKEAHTALGRIDILVNNAGSSPGRVGVSKLSCPWGPKIRIPSSPAAGHQRAVPAGQLSER